MQIGPLNVSVRVSLLWCVVCEVDMYNLFFSKLYERSPSLKYNIPPLSYISSGNQVFQPYESMKRKVSLVMYRTEPLNQSNDGYEKK